MSAAMTDIAVTGVGQTKHVEARRDVTLSEMIFEATTAALHDAEISRDQVDAVVLGAHDLVDGRGISSMITATAAGSMFRDEIRVADDGAFAALLGCMRILSGEFRTVLVASWSKCSESSIDLFDYLAGDPIYQRPLGLTGTSACALQAASFQAREPASTALAADVVVRNRANGCANPHAHLKSPVTAADVATSAPKATPLRALDLPPRSDGACAIVIQCGDLARARDRRVAWVNGVGWSSERYLLGGREFASLPSAAAAADRCYVMAGIESPPDEIDAVELHAQSAFHELMLYEALGLVNSRGGGDLATKVADLVRTGPTLNASGGAFCANPYTATGLIRFAEAALHVMGRSAMRPAIASDTALAHATSGLGSQSNFVALLGSAPRTPQ
jgi:acetyl-CoA C-acetyltransferase